MSKTKLIKVSEQTHTELFFLKIRYKANNIDEVIRRLIQEAEANEKTKKR